MNRNRRYTLAAIVVVLGLLTVGILLEVLGTILFAITVAYVLAPVHRWLIRRGLSSWMAGILATLVGFVSVLAVLAPLVFTLYHRLDEAIELVETLPDEFSVTWLDMTVAISAEQLQEFLISIVQGMAGSVATALPVLGLKFALFVIVLFALLQKGDSAARAAIAPVPREYRDIVFALAYRARETLYAIYVLQVATSVATFLVAFPFFYLLGYDSALILATVAAILQFVPIIGPSLLVVPIALYHLAVGELVAGALVGVGGILLIAWMPDMTVRPRLAQYSVGLPGSLYFIGFIGGLFTLGPIGIVVGPLIVAVFVEAVELLAAEVNSTGSLSDAVTAAGAERGRGTDVSFEEAAVGAESTEGVGSQSGPTADPNTDPDRDRNTDPDSGPASEHPDSVSESTGN